MTRQIVQEWLNRTSACFVANDFATYKEHMAFPVSITTDGGGNWTITDEAMLQNGFDAWVRMMHEQRVTHLVRTVRNYEVIEGGDLWALYTAELLSNAVRVVPAYDSYLRLRNVDGGWKCDLVLSGLANPTWPVIVPRVKTAKGPPGGAWPDPARPSADSRYAPSSPRSGDSDRDRS